jgi:hypothetical protein
MIPLEFLCQSVYFACRNSNRRRKNGIGSVSTSRMLLLESFSIWHKLLSLDRISERTWMNCTCK